MYCTCSCLLFVICAVATRAFYVAAIKLFHSLFPLSTPTHTANLSENLDGAVVLDREAKIAWGTVADIFEMLRQCLELVR